MQHGHAHFFSSLFALFRSVFLSCYILNLRFCLEERKRNKILCFASKRKKFQFDLKRTAYPIPTAIGKRLVEIEFGKCQVETGNTVRVIVKKRIVDHLVRVAEKKAFKNKGGA
jgi:hypothetical protein